MLSQVISRAYLCVSMYVSCSTATWGGLTHVLSEFPVRIVQLGQEMFRIRIFTLGPDPDISSIKKLKTLNGLGLETL